VYLFGAIVDLQLACKLALEFVHQPVAIDWPALKNHTADILAILKNLVCALPVTCFVHTRLANFVCRDARLAIAACAVQYGNEGMNELLFLWFALAPKVRLKLTIQIEF